MTLPRLRRLRAAILIATLTCTALVAPSSASAAGGGEITYQNGIVTTLPVLVSWRSSYGPHDGGLVRIDRWRATNHANESCGAFAFDASIATPVRNGYGGPFIFDDYTASPGYCYQYRLFDYDQLGNFSEYSSPSIARLPGPPLTTPGEVRVDTIPPTGAHVATLPHETTKARLSWNASTGGTGGVRAYAWCIAPSTSSDCTGAVRSGVPSIEADIATIDADFVPGVSYVACVRANDFASNWSALGCSAPFTRAAAPPPPPCAPKVGPAMTRSVAYGQAYIYTLTDWARCPFPLGEPTTHVDYMMCRKGVPTNCYRSTHGVGSVQIARDVRAAGLPLVEAKPVWKTEGIPSARFIGHSKRSNTWDVTVTVRSAHRSVVLHQWTLLTGAASTSCDQQSLQVVADTAASGSQTASASITCGGSAQASAATTARATYSVRGRSPWASVRVSSNGRASYTATNVPSGVTTDSFAIVAEVGSATFERHVTVNLTRHAVGTDDNDAMVGSNTNVTASGTKSARAKRPSARGDVLLGGGGHDTIHGRGGDDLLRGQAGSDVLYPGPGANVTEGGVGNDRIFVVSPLDVVSGGAGNDTITIQSKVGPRRITCGPGRDTVIAARPLRLPKDCERLVVRKAKR